MLSELRVEPGVGAEAAWGDRRDSPSSRWTRGTVGLGYTHTDRLGNRDVDVIGAADSLTGDVMLTAALIIVVVLLSAWIGVTH